MAAVEVEVEEAVMTAVEVAQWVAEVAVEGVPLVVAPVVDVAGATSVSGRRTSLRFTIPGSGRKRTGWSPGLRLSPMTRPNTLFVRVPNLMQVRVLTVSL